MTRTTASELKIVELSDIHLGHQNTPTVSILKGLYRLLRETPENTETDLLILAGDVFDRELTFPDNDLVAIRKWIADVLIFCKKHDIVLRVLEGTPSHDWKQSFEFEHTNEQAGIGADVRHVKMLGIERIEKLNIDVLYVPDEWRADNGQTWLEVQELLVQKNLTKVDFAVMHGTFPHQIPEEASKWMHFHSPDNYLSIVKHHIFIGHIHQYSQFDRILSAGSFDRLTHGDESPKGSIHYRLKSDGTYDIRFVVNKEATVYKTIDLRETIIEECLDKVVETVADDYPHGSKFRLWIERSDGLSHLMTALKRLYPQHSWTTKVMSLQSQRQDSGFVLAQRVTMQPLTPETLLTAVSERLKSEYPEKSDLCIELLKKLIRSS